MWRRLLAFMLVLGAACSSPNAPHGGLPPGLSFVTGNQQTDTVTSVLNQALVVQVRNGGARAANVVVQFLAVSAADSSHPNAGDWVYPEALTSSSPSPFVAETTNTSGEAVVSIVLGQRVGKGLLLVKVPQLGFVDTAKFTVTVGGAAALQAGPADTAAYVNANVAFHSSIVDKYGNPRTDPVTYAVVSGPAHVSGSQITPTAIGQVVVTATADHLMDTSYITVVPSGTLGGTLDGGGVVVFNLDGSNYKTITTKTAGTVAWAPSGSSLAFDQTAPNGGSGGTQNVFAVTTGGAVSVLDNSGGAIDAWPKYSRDGTWIYYCKFGSGTNLWRVHPDGTEDAAVTMQAGSPLVTFPSPSPDGTQLVYAQDGYGAVYILNLSTGVSTQLGSMLALSASWSPNSNVIAIDEDGPIGLIHSDGTGHTVLTTTLYEPELAWSPDGNWIAARNALTGQIDLLSVATPGLVLTLPFTGGIGSPTWH